MLSERKSHVLRPSGDRENGVLFLFIVPALIMEVTLEGQLNTVLSRSAHRSMAWCGVAGRGAQSEFVMFAPGGGGRCTTATEQSGQ